MDIIDAIFKISSFILKTLGVFVISGATLGVIGLPFEKDSFYSLETRIAASIIGIAIGIFLFFLPELIKRTLSFPSKDP